MDIGILVIEQSPIVSRKLCGILQLLGFRNMYLLSTVEDAMLFLDISSHKIQMCFVDLMLPTISGYEFLSFVKERSRHSHIPVFLMSNVFDENLENCCFVKGAEEVMLKPITVEKLAKIMSKYRYVGHALTIPQHVVVTSISQIAPEFSLLNSRNEEYHFIPTELSKAAYVFAFVPSIFLDELYEAETAFIPMLCQEYTSALLEDVKFYSSTDANPELSDIEFCVISNDMPCVLGAAKKKFNLPFTLLSDVSLSVSRAYVGCICDLDSIIGKADSTYQGHSVENALVDDSSDQSTVQVFSHEDICSLWENHPHDTNDSHYVEGAGFRDKHRYEMEDITLAGSWCPLLAVVIVDKAGRIRSQWTAQNEQQKVDISVLCPGLLPALRQLREEVYSRGILL